MPRIVRVTLHPNWARNLSTEIVRGEEQVRVPVSVVTSSDAGQASHTFSMLIPITNLRFILSKVDPHYAALHRAYNDKVKST